MLKSSEELAEHRPSWSGEVSRKIVRRIVVEGDLVLQTPAHLGNGDGDNLVDMPLLTDPVDEKTPLLTGASIAGALRGYLHERENGYRAQVMTNADAKDSAIVLLFGSNKGYDYGEQSPLIVEDAYGKNNHIELRDGVGLAGDSHTAAKDKLFNVEMWEAGTTFLLRFELVVRQNDNVSELKEALATALAGLTNGSITIGARKRRGYGKVDVTGWHVKEYNLLDTAKLLDWLEHGAKALDGATKPSIVQALGVAKERDDKRHAFRLTAKFFLDRSLLIRSGSGPNIEGSVNNDEIVRPDFMHLHSSRLIHNTRTPVPILSGTSLAGALRARALKIACLIVADVEEGKKKASNLIDDMFGADMATVRDPRASRVTVYEHEVKLVQNMLVQNRVSIDRFTGGARDGALFSEQPLFGDKQSVVTVDLQLANPEDHEIGLLLLVLKDLWMGDLPLGGEISVGRGRLHGKSCDLVRRNGQEYTWRLVTTDANGLRLEQGKAEDLEKFVDELHTHLAGSNS